MNLHHTSPGNLSCLFGEVRSGHCGYCGTFSATRKSGECLLEVQSSWLGVQKKERCAFSYSVPNCLVKPTSTNFRPASDTVNNSRGFRAISWARNASVAWRMRVLLAFTVSR